MGATDFSTKASGTTAREAFKSARDDAAYEHGHGGYTGTIAEKHGFEMIAAREGETIRETVDRLIESNDKFGPAFCLDMGKGDFLFFGIASE